MANVFDYLNWRDINLKNVEFNEIDGLILSCISYFPFDNLVNESEEKTLNEIYKSYMKTHKELIMRKKEDIEFYPILSKSKRSLVQYELYVRTKERKKKWIIKKD